MRLFTRIILTAVITLTAFSTVTYTACKQDKCKGIACINGGACQDGACICPAGYTGTHCENSPTPDPCAGINCQNGGTCSGGTCTCPSGYEGTHCENKVNAKFVGVYNVTDNCNTGGPFTYQVTITADPVNPAGVMLRNLGDYGCTSGGEITFAGTVNGAQLTVNDNQCSTHMTANGTLVGNTLSLSYVAVYGIPSVTDSCTSVLVK